MSSQPPQDPLIGTTVAGRFKILRLLGEGGMGQVYLAEHVAIQKRIALKVLRAEYAHKGEIVTRFQQEAISASRIKHPNVLDVFDFGQLENGCFYLAMEFLEGCDLADELQRQRALTAPRVLPIALQICRALSAAHAKGVVHRDMKPENVFLQRTADGEEIVKIVDFGIAQLRSNDEAAAESKRRRLTRTGMIFGTPEYMAPEQAGGKHADLRTDVYAVGIILYEMFTGAVPFTGETFLGVLAKHLNEPPPSMRAIYPDVGISPELENVILRALTKDPEHRYQSMSDFAQALLATPEGAFAGTRGPYSSVLDRGSFLPAASASPTSPQFSGRALPLVNVIQPGPGGAASPGAAPGVSRDAATVASAATQARAETQLGGEAATQPPVKSSSGAPKALFAVLGVLVVGGGVAAFTLRSGPAPAPAPVQSSPAARPEAPPVAPEPVPAPSPAPSSVAPVTEPAAIKLQVETEPAGATVLKDGFQVCDTAPCEVLAKPNETLELQAKKGALKGSVKVLAQRDQKVSIKLAGGGAAPPKPGGPRLCEFEIEDGLKVLRPCP